MALIDGDNQIYYYQNDVNGLPAELTKPNGDIVWSATYDEMGRVENILVDEVDQPLRMQGQYYDAQTDLCHNRYRYFDPQTCSFISQDPLGLAAGENVYAYAPNVWSWVDPMGLLCNQTGKYATSADKIAKLGRYAKFGPVAAGGAAAAAAEFLGLATLAAASGFVIGRYVIGPYVVEPLMPSVNMVPYERPKGLEITNYINTDDTVIYTTEGFYTSQGNKVSVADVGDWMTRRNQKYLSQTKIENWEKTYKKFSSKWDSGSLKKALDDFVPGVSGEISDDGVKTIYKNSSYEIKHDNLFNYFRIKNLETNQYVDKTGSVVKTGHLTGKQAKNFLQEMTHIKNTD